MASHSREHAMSQSEDLEKVLNLPWAESDKLSQCVYFRVLKSYILILILACLPVAAVEATEVQAM